MLAKRFFYVSAALLMLAATYHLGAKSATAQAGATGWGYAAVLAGPQSVHYVMTPSGDVYARGASVNVGDWNVETFGGSPAHYVGNFWGGATASSPTSWGKVKADYRK